MCLIRVACLAIAALGQAAHAQIPVGAAGPEERSLLLDVELNGRMLGLVGSFQERDGRLRAEAAELRALGLVVSAAADRSVPLDLLPGVTWWIDERRQVLRLRAPNVALRPTMVGSDGPTVPGRR